MECGTYMQFNLWAHKPAVCVMVLLTKVMVHASVITFVTTKLFDVQLYCVVYIFLTS